MHANAFDWVRRHAVADPVSVVEIGSRDVNGTVRGLFPQATWWGIDVEGGDAVDEVADGSTWQPAAPVDVVVSCEVLEHAAEWREIVANGVEMLRPGGLLILTAAGPERAPHSAVDGGDLREGEFYENIDPDELAAVLAATGVEFVVDVLGGDVRAVGRKPAKAKRRAA